MLLGSAAPAAFDVALWDEGVDAAALGTLIGRHSHPCGAIAIVRLRAMPPHDGDGSGFATDLVVEADSDGSEIRRWSVPVDYAPLALRGDEILVDHAGQLLWIGTSGSLRRGAPQLDRPPLVAIQCPAQGALAGSDFARCAAVADLRTRRRRLIHYEGPCT